MDRVAFPLFYQQDRMGCGPTCLRMVAKYHYDRDYIFEFLRDIAENGADGTTLQGLSQAAEKIGFHTLGVKITLQKLIDDAPLPCILHWNGCHYVVLYKYKTEIHAKSNVRKYFIADPALGFYTLDEIKFSLHWLTKEPNDMQNLSLNGIALLLEKTSDFKQSIFKIS